MWAYSPQNRNFFCINLPVGKFWGSTEKVEYKCTAFGLSYSGETPAWTTVGLPSISLHRNCSSKGPGGYSACTGYRRYSCTNAAWFIGSVWHGRPCHSTATHRDVIRHGGTVLGWFGSYLSGRIQTISCGMSASDASAVLCGVENQSINQSIRRGLEWPKYI